MHNNQLTQFDNLSSWRRDTLHLKPHEMFTLDFIDTRPNQFVIVNPNMARLKVSISTIPTEEHFEHLVEGNTTETFGRPMQTGKIYILNDSSIEVNILVFSVFDVFNLAILKNMNVSLEGYTLNCDTEISGVAAGVKLPVHDSTAIEVLNKILGKTNSTDLTKVLADLSTIINKLDNVGGGTDNTGVENLLTLIKNSNLVTESNTGALKTTLSNILDKVGLIENYMNPSEDHTANVETMERVDSDVLQVRSGDPMKSININFLTNDGDNDIKLIIMVGKNNTATWTKEITVKAGETISNLALRPFATEQVNFAIERVTGTTMSFRCLYTYTI